MHVQVCLGKTRRTRLLPNFSQPQPDLIVLWQQTGLFAGNTHVCVCVIYEWLIAGMHVISSANWQSDSHVWLLAKVQVGRLHLCCIMAWSLRGPNQAMQPANYLPTSKSTLVWQESSDKSLRQVLLIMQPLAAWTQVKVRHGSDSQGAICRNWSSQYPCLNSLAYKVTGFLNIRLDRFSRCLFFMFWKLIWYLHTKLA